MPVLNNKGNMADYRISSLVTSPISEPSTLSCRSFPILAVDAEGVSERDAVAAGGALGGCEAGAAWEFEPVEPAIR